MFRFLPFRTALSLAVAFVALAGSLFFVSAPASAAATPSAHVALAAPVALLAQAAPTPAGVGPDAAGTMSNGINSFINIFTSGPAKGLVVLAIIGVCVTLLARPDHHELIGNLSKVILIGIVIFTAQSIVGTVLPH